MVHMSIHFEFIKDNLFLCYYHTSSWRMLRANVLSNVLLELFELLIIHLEVRIICLCLILLVIALFHLF
jgi:hypothetical protein